MVKHASLARNEDGIRTAIGVLKQQYGEALHTGQSIREQHGHTTTWIENQPPDAVFFAQSAEEISNVVCICAEHNVPVIAYGTGTSLEGHLNAPAGGICVDVTRMDRVLEVNPGDLDCRVQPGVTREDLNAYLRYQGQFFPVDPGANASLGGMAATNASGTNAVLYGTMKDNVLALEAVMADGRIIRTGTRARKSSAGYDLTRLLVGSEGSLCIITEITLKLRGIPESINSARCSFPTVDAACQTVMSVIQYGLPVARIELLDETMVKAINSYASLALPETPLLLLEFHGTEASVTEQAEIFSTLSVEHGGSGYQATTTTEERNKLWKARHDAYWAMLQYRPGAEGVATDVCVPISRLAECVTAAQARAEELKLVVPIIGHVGDGNFHATPLVDMTDADEVARATEFVAWLNEYAISMDGTCTGEHGIGQGKVAYLARELGAATEFMADIKQALDPKNILNPGKIFER